MNQTLTYYTNNAQLFTEGTVNVDFTSTQNKFLDKLPSGASILDFGCGSGRDTKYFHEMGYEVEAIDGSEELCRFASEYSGVEVPFGLFKPEETVLSHTLATAALKSFYNKTVEVID